MINNGMANGIMLSAPQSESGKTMVCCALLSYLKSQNIAVTSYKCGPDYIDPMFHKKCIGISSENLDGYFLDGEKLKEVYDKSMQKNHSTFSIIEGAMGLFDGLGGISEEASAYEIASVLNLPIILVINARGMGRSIIPLIAGYLKYDKNHLIKGVILNKITKSYYSTIKDVIENELDIKVYGYMPRLEETIGSRHLGLMLPDEIEDIKRILDKMGNVAGESIDIEGLLSLGDYAGKCHSLVDHTGEDHSLVGHGSMDALASNENCVIAVARDEAFCFYYEENLRLLEQYGANIRYFSPLHDKELPADAQAILLGGGYPENYAKELSANASMLESIRTANSNEMPIVAECGGFMYLHDTLYDQEGNGYSMVGVIPGEVRYTGKLVRFGYVEIEGNATFIEKEHKVRGHEFHYYDSTNNGDSCTLTKPITGRNWKGIHVDDKHWMGFAHLYYGSCPEFAKAFVDKAVEFGRSN